MIVWAGLHSLTWQFLRAIESCEHAHFRRCFTPFNFQCKNGKCINSFASSYIFCCCFFFCGQIFTALSHTNDRKCIISFFSYLQWSHVCCVAFNWNKHDDLFLYPLLQKVSVCFEAKAFYRTSAQSFITCVLAHLFLSLSSFSVSLSHSLTHSLTFCLPYDPFSFGRSFSRLIHFDIWTNANARIYLI